MSKAIPLLFFSFLFIFIFSASVYAGTEPILDANILTEFDAQVYGGCAFWCSDATGTFNCYYAGPSKFCPGGTCPTYIFRYNESLDYTGNCTIGIQDTYNGCSLFNAMGQANSTHAVMQLSNGTYYLSNVTDEAFTEGVCGHSAGFGAGGPQHLDRATLGFYDPSGAGAVGFFYHGADGYNDIDKMGMYNTTTAVKSGLTPFWQDNTMTIRLSNQSDNSTIYVMKADYYFERYDNGVLGASYDRPQDIWQQSLNGPHKWDVWQPNATKSLIFFVNGTPATTRYIMVADFGNITYYGNETNATTLLYNSQAIGNVSTYQTVNQLGVWLDSEVNGTIMWYFDGSNFANTTVNQSVPINDGTFFYSTGARAVGSHCWDAVYISADDGTPTNMTCFAWGEPICYTIITEAGSMEYLYENPMNGMALIIGGFFSVDDLETAQTISGLLLSLLGSVAFAVGISMISKHIEGEMIINLTIVGYMTLILMFAMLGWIPGWMTLILLILTGYAFVKLSGIGGG